MMGAASMMSFVFGSGNELDFELENTWAGGGVSMQ